MNTYDRQGNPIDMAEWSRLHSDYNYKVVKQEKVQMTEEVEYLVSTVWLGLDHGWGSSKPVIFETMVFGPDDMTDLECERYCTEDEALEGHQRMVKQVRETARSLQELTKGP